MFLRSWGDCWMSKLGQYVNIKTGKLDANASSENGQYPFFTCAMEPLKIDSYSYDCECVLVAGNGDLNVKYYCGKFDAYQRTYIIESKNKSYLDVQYLYCFLDKYIETLRSLSIGGVIKYIKLGNLTEADIPIPDITKQKEIVSILDKATHTIDLCNSILEKLDLLVKSQFVEMFGCIDLTPQNEDWFEISEIGTVIGGSTPKTSISEYWDGDLKWITPAELDIDSGYIYDSVRKITTKGAESCSLQLLPKETVILTSRAPIGKVGIAGEELFCNQGFKNIICNGKIVPRYLYSILLFNTEYLNSLGRGATFKEISKSIVEKIRIPVPPLELQTQFADFVQQIDKSKLAVKKTLEKAEMLKKALMQEYFG